MGQQYQVNMTVTPWTVQLAQIPIGSQLSKAGVVQFIQSQQQVSVVFATPLQNLASPIYKAYSLVATLLNTADPFPADLVVKVVSFTTSGFTLSINAPADTNNYWASWMVVGNVNG